MVARPAYDLVPLTPNEIIHDQRKYISQLEWACTILGLAFLLIWMSRR